jgi:thiol-disulfide isomerase/thioredoxin
MNKGNITAKLGPVIRFLKPWVITLVLVLVLKYTGALSSIAGFSNAAIMETGLMDFEPETETKAEAEEPFDYNFSIKDLQGNEVDFNQFKGKVVFINLWATWCGPCRAEMPSIQALYDSVKKDNIEFVMLSLDAPQSQHKISKYIDDKSFTFPIYVPGNGLPEQLSVPSIPTTFVISKDGKIKTKKVGTARYNTRKFREYLIGLAK